MISCCANEIEMKGFNAKNEKLSKKMPLAKHGLVHEKEITPNLIL